jgi:phosphoribosylaminoimidazole-succinocarboxamide synthase
MLQSNVAEYPCRRGKVRDVYDLGDRLLIVATDRISAFDWILPTAIPGKGKILTQMTLFWLRHLNVPNHFLSDQLADFPLPFQRPEFEGRSMLARKTTVFPVECVVRGYLVGSGWKDYQRTGTVCGVPLPSGMVESAELSPPIFTPATKAESGHDINIDFASMCQAIGLAAASELRDRSIDLYTRAANYGRTRGVIIADTKFEWGRTDDGSIILIDEVLTPDSSRFWPADQYVPGQPQPSFDKQFVRDYLETTTWDKNSPAPELPPHIAEQTGEKYRDALDRLTRR